MRCQGIDRDPQGVGLIPLSTTFGKSRVWKETTFGSRNCIWAAEDHLAEGGKGNRGKWLYLFSLIATVSSSAPPAAFPCLQYLPPSSEGKIYKLSWYYLFHWKFKREPLVKVLKQQKKNGRGTGLVDIDSYRCLYLLETELHSVLQPPAPATRRKRKGKRGHN